MSFLQRMSIFAATFLSGLLFVTRAVHGILHRMVLTSVDCDKLGDSPKISVDGQKNSLASKARRQGITRLGCSRETAVAAIDAFDHPRFSPQIPHEMKLDFSASLCRHAAHSTKRYAQSIQMSAQPSLQRSYLTYGHLKTSSRLNVERMIF